jgi:hypothetical protein
MWRRIVVAGCFEGIYMLLRPQVDPYWVRRIGRVEYCCYDEHDPSSELRVVIY